MRRLAALLFTAAPFVAGTVAALSARRDLRMLVMAVAATLVARLIVNAAPLRWKRGMTFAVALTAATIAAAMVALLFGARAPFGVGAVAVVLAGCATTGAAMSVRGS